MIINFFTKEEIVCKSLIQAANFNGHECFVSKDFETIYEKILETQLEPDLFVLDYTLFNPLLFNPFKFLTSKNLFIPLIIYNDPFAPKEFKVGYWKNLLKTFYPTNRINFEKYKELHPNIDLVTMDITMPKMDGITALEQIMAFDKSARVVMVSALGKEELVKKSLLLGARNYIIKPLDRKKVLERISASMK